MKKKYIYINGRFMTQTITGVQRYAIEVIRSLDWLLSKGDINGKQYKFIILAPQNTKYNLNLNNISVQVVGRLNSHLWEQIELPFFSSNGLLVNLCNTAPMFSGYQILTIHDASVSANKNNYSFLFKFWYQFLYRILPFRTKKIVTDSNFSKDELIKYYPIKEEKIKTIYLGTEHLKPVKSNNEILQKFNLGNTTYILAVSNMNPNKNFSGIITALNYIKNQDLQVVIVGPKDNPIYSEVDLNSSLRINLVGYVSDEELSTLYKNAACFVYPSFYEGFGLPPLEAMVNGCPVIVSNKASLPEVLGDAAIYCDPYEPKDIAEKIEQVLNDENLRNELKIKGLERVNIYSWERCALEIFKVMMEVMDS
ncbi:glycosyltransferase family 4 protein [Lysinibacillus pakistanensis]|uniref:Glycosyltransferase n=1 Tax=Lysinibacillus pakistanensis TaxID=759811 RepID=A0ABX6D607_9BACI|nr:glycosyltransferase [Lysinibacillus pakistanensis]